MPTYLEKYAKQNNLKRKDAKKPLTIVLRKRDVMRSKMKDATSCAFAECAKDTIPGVKSAHFFRSTAWLEVDGDLIRYHLPPSVQKEIVSFDRSREMEPGVYTLSAPTKTATMAATAKRRALDKRRNHMRVGKNKAPAPRHRTVGVRTLAGQVIK